MSGGTFTFRIPDNMAARLGSAEMRSWLNDFLRNPHALPPDPGSGYERTSLTLPRELVAHVAGYLRCSPSTALRRLAQERLSPKPPTTISPPTIPRPAPFATPAQTFRTAPPVPRHPVATGPRSISHQDKVAAAIGQVIAGALSLAIVFLVLYVSGKLKSAPKRP